MKTKLVLVCLALCFVLLAIVLTPSAVAACSGDDCGCGEAANECFAECAALNCSLSCKQACVGACVRAFGRCLIACCGHET